MAPGAWEIATTRGRRMLLITITPPDLAISLSWADYVERLVLPLGSTKTRIVGLPWGPARNQAAKLALENNCHLAFLDADCLPYPPDAFVKMLDSGLELVGGLYYQRFFPFQPVLFNEDRDDKGNIVRVPIQGWRPGDMVPATFIPAGFTLYRRSLLEKMFQRFPRPFEWGLDTAPVPTEGGQLPTMSEDFVFSWRAKTFLGVLPYIMTSCYALHEVRSVVGPKWHPGLMAPSPEPLHGLVGVV